jgi:hypothetical protein
MSQAQVERTLVKSPPELWAELSNPASLARHLGELGEIRITRIVPEQKVEWTADNTSGSVLIKPSGWGTRVTLTASRDSSDAKTQPEAAEPEPLTAPPSPASLDTEPPKPRLLTTAPPATPQTAPDRQPPHVKAEQAPDTPATPPRDAPAEKPPMPGPAAAATGAPRAAASELAVAAKPEPAPAPAAPKPAPAPHPAPDASSAPAASCAPAQARRAGETSGRFLGRLLSRMRRGRAAHAPLPPTRPPATRVAAPIVDNAASAAPPLPTTLAKDTSAARPQRTPASRTEPDAERPAPPPAAPVASGPAAQLATATAPARTPTSSPSPPERAPDTALATQSPRVDAPSDARAASPQAPVKPLAPSTHSPADKPTAYPSAPPTQASATDDEEFNEVLRGVLDSLGSAHHRPFSRP